MSQIININKTSKNYDQNYNVTVYLRKSSKQAILLHLPKLLTLQQLRTIILNKLKIDQTKMHLFYKGKQLQKKGWIRIEDKAILHLVNYNNVDKKHITIHIKFITTQSSLTFQVQSISKIQTFIYQQFYKVSNLNSHKIFFVYLGKCLDPSKTFTEQFVQNHSEIICINSKKYTLSSIPKPLQNSPIFPPNPSPNLSAQDSAKQSSSNSDFPVIIKRKIFDESEYFSEVDQLHFQKSLDKEP